MRAYVEADRRWTAGRTAWANGVVTLRSAFPADFEVPDLPRFALHDRDDQSFLRERLMANIRNLAHGRRPPTVDEVELIGEILTGRLATTFDVEAEAAEREAVAQQVRLADARDAPDEDAAGPTSIQDSVELRLSTDERAHA